MKILFAGGGTAGHINPAISIADYIKAQDSEFKALFVGTQKGLEKKLVPASGYDIKYIDICGFDRKHLLKNVSVLMKLAKSRSDTRKIIRDFKPDAVVCTGGYVSGPTAMAAYKEGVPAVIHEQNVYPGLTVKGSEKYVKYILVSFLETLSHLKNPKKCVVTGNPIRTEILSADKAAARKSLGLDNKPFVLVFGGSLGAEKINDTMIEVIKKLQNDDRINLMFGTGDRNYTKVMEKLNESGVVLGENKKVVPYIDNMHLVMAASDLVVSRAGAITISEIAALGKPSILIPSPNVVRNHQEQNARELEKQGAAAVITEDVLSAEILYDKIFEIIGDEKVLFQMSDSSRKMGKTDALEKIYAVVQEISGKK